MKFYVLASGSKGNCTVIESGQQFIIIDCGATKKYLLKCFEEINKNYLDAQGILITHDHSDHVKQIKMFNSLPVYSPCELLSVKNEIHVTPYEKFSVGNFEVLPLPLSHDASAVVGYVISDGEEVLVSLTDTGYLPHANERLIKDANYYIFESNYDTAMLMNSNRPAYLKARINSDYGHLENGYASNMISKIIGPHTKEVVLAHISQECNTREIALKTLIDTLEANNIDPNKYQLYAAEQFGIYYGGK